jgi:hypothetical protein
VSPGCFDRDRRLAREPLRLRAQVQRRAAREQESAQHGAERLGRDGRASQRGDRSRDGIGLLSRETSLLERERGDVARGKDILSVADPSELVDRDEAVLVVRESGKPWALEYGQSDHTVGEHFRSAGEQQHAAAHHGGERR